MAITEDSSTPTPTPKTLASKSVYFATFPTEEELAAAMARHQAQSFVIRYGKVVQCSECIQYIGEAKFQTDDAQGVGSGCYVYVSYGLPEVRRPNLRIREPVLARRPDCAIL
jgi:hypothetical protein